MLVRMVMAFMTAQVLAGCGPSAAEIEEQKILAALEQSSAELTDFKPVPGADKLTAVVKAGGDHVFKVPLEQGGYYRVTARCGTGCSVIHMESADPTGAWDGQDIADGVVPDQFFQPKMSGEWSIKVKMIRCSQPECHVGVRAERSVAR
jgi:hypothetical protein